MSTFITTDRKLATHLFKVGYTNYEISERDGSKVWIFNVPDILAKKLNQESKKFYQG